MHRNRTTSNSEYIRLMLYFITILFSKEFIALFLAITFPYIGSLAGYTCIFLASNILMYDMLHIMKSLRNSNSGTDIILTFYLENNDFLLCLFLCTIYAALSIPSAFFLPVVCISILQLLFPFARKAGYKARIMLSYTTEIYNYFANCGEKTKIIVHLYGALILAQCLYAPVIYLSSLVSITLIIQIIFSIIPFSIIPLMTLYKMSNLIKFIIKIIMLSLFYFF